LVQNTEKGVYMRKILILCFLFSMQVIFLINIHAAEETFMRIETIRFNANFSIKIAIPENWIIEQARGTPVPLTGQTYDLIVKPSSSEKALLRITIGRTTSERGLNEQQFSALINSRVSQFLSGAVENEATYTEVQVVNGTARYCVLTDASLVNRTLGSNDYLYLPIYFANYISGHIVYATALNDDISGESFHSMIQSLSTIEIL
jgi:hypothetical protein